MDEKKAASEVKISEQQKEISEIITLGTELDLKKTIKYLAQKAKTEKLDFTETIKTLAESFE